MHTNKIASAAALVLCGCLVPTSAQFYCRDNKVLRHRGYNDMSLYQVGKLAIYEERVAIIASENECIKFDSRNPAQRATAMALIDSLNTLGNRIVDIEELLDDFELGDAENLHSHFRFLLLANTELEYLVGLHESEYRAKRNTI